MRWVVVRHGETTGQSSIRYFGATDVPLSESGRRQMHAVANAVRGQLFEAVYTSELSRTVEAARIIRPEMQAIPLGGLNEVNFGRWEGLTQEEISDRDPDLFRTWQASHAAFTFPMGDAVSEFRARVRATIRGLAETSPQTALLIVHKGTIRTIATELLGLSEAERSAWPIDLASIHVFVRESGLWRNETKNQVSHLECLQAFVES